MHRFIGHTLLLGSLLGLLVGCGEVVPGGNGNIAGTVTAPAGGDVAGTRVYACLANDPNCESLNVAVEQSGSSAAYRIFNLASGSYGVIALKDVDGDGNPGIGDYYGNYKAADGRPGLVTPPESGVDIQMMVLTDPAHQVPQAVRELSDQAP